jgi:phenylalanyl-tRNA synthetase beta subunit
MKIAHSLLQSFFEQPLPDSKTIEKSLIFKAFEVEAVTTIGNEIVYDIKILPDRAPDCLSHIGIARELGAQLGIPITIPLYEEDTTKETQLKITVEAPFVRRYIGVVIRNVTVESSPIWLREALTSLGLKSINTVVDITNYILHYYGTPMHVFDYDKMHPRIVVRNAIEGESITTLDGNTYTLVTSDTLITDGEHPLAIAGVKGGIHAEVTAQTKTLLLEVANFDPVMVRKTARRISLLTDAAKRFENNFSSNALDASLQHALYLFKNLARGTVETPVDCFLLKEEKVKISLLYKTILEFLGITIPENTVQSLLESVGCECVKIVGGWEVTPPYWRKDMHTASDCIDEVVRLYGYEHIPNTPYSLGTTVTIPASVAQCARLRIALQNAGFSEVYTYSFGTHGVRSVHAPLAKEKKYLRDSLKDQFVVALENNRARCDLLGVTLVKVFEIGTVFLKDDESIHIIVSTSPESRRILEEEKLTIISEDAVCIEAIITTASTSVSFDPLLFPEAPSGVITPWSSYPYIVRDISLWAPESVSQESLRVLLEQHALYSPVPIRCIDEYHKEGRVSYTFRIVFQSFDRTLTDKEVEGYMEVIYQHLTKVSNVQIR